MWATAMPILVFLGLSILNLGPMYVTDRQTSDTHHRSMLPTLRAGHNKIANSTLTLASCCLSNITVHDFCRFRRVTFCMCALTVYFLVRCTFLLLVIWATNQLGDRLLGDNQTGRKPTGRHILVNLATTLEESLKMQTWAKMSIRSPCVMYIHG